MAGDRRALCLVAGAILLCSCFARVLCGDEQEQQQEKEEGELFNQLEMEPSNEE